MDHLKEQPQIHSFSLSQPIEPSYRTISSHCQSKEEESSSTTAAARKRVTTFAKVEQSIDGDDDD